ncbi:hypothetical protein D3C73_952600 [compost metagenome]
MPGIFQYRAQHIAANAGQKPAVAVNFKACSHRRNHVNPAKISAQPDVVVFIGKYIVNRVMANGTPNFRIVLVIRKSSFAGIKNTQSILSAYPQKAFLKRNFPDIVVNKRIGILIVVLKNPEAIVHYIKAAEAIACTHPHITTGIGCNGSNVIRRHG